MGLGINYVILATNHMVSLITSTTMNPWLTSIRFKVRAQVRVAARGSTHGFVYFSLCFTFVVLSTPNLMF